MRKGATHAPIKAKTVEGEGHGRDVRATEGAEEGCEPDDHGLRCAPPVSTFLRPAGANAFLLGSAGSDFDRDRPLCSGAFSFYASPC